MARFSLIKKRENASTLSRCERSHSSMWGNNDHNCDPLYIYSFKLNHVTLFDAICSIKQSHVIDYVPNWQEGQNRSNGLVLVNN